MPVIPSGVPLRAQAGRNAVERPRRSEHVLSFIGLLLGRDDTARRRGQRTERSFVEKTAVILNGVSPGAQAGAKRSEEPSPRDAYGTAGQSLTVPRAVAVGVLARTTHQTASARVQSAILHCVPVRKASRNSVQDDGRVFRSLRARTHWQRSPALAASVCLALALAFSGCDSRRQREPEKIRELNEIPIAQLRVLIKGFPGEWRPDSDREHRTAEPPAEKAVPPGAKRIALVPLADIHLGDMPVREAIAARRSARDFTDAALSLEELSFLLWATQGVTGVQRDEAGAVVQRFRAAPSGGARYPLETYLSINRVNGLAPGLYRYLPNDHELVLVREDAQISAKLQAACYGTPAVGGAAVVFIWAAVPCRTEWKYTYLAHRMIAVEAGHVCENLYLAAESCGTGACAMLSYHQPAVDELLGVDGQEEFAIYLACVGKPKPE